MSIENFLGAGRTDMLIDVFNQDDGCMVDAPLLLCDDDVLPFLAEVRALAQRWGQRWAERLGDGSAEQEAVALRVAAAKRSLTAAAPRPGRKSKRNGDSLGRRGRSGNGALRVASGH